MPPAARGGLLASGEAGVPSFLVSPLGAAAGGAPAVMAAEPDIGLASPAGSESRPAVVGLWKMEMQMLKA